MQEEAVVNTQQVTLEENKKEKWGISGSTLKIIAIVTMLIDHIGASIVERGILPYYADLASADSTGNMVMTSSFQMWYMIDIILRFIGRIAFPIFVFLLVQGFLHTHDIKKYAVRLLAFCFISEIPFDMAFNGAILEFSHQNVFFTLFIGLIVLIGVKKNDERYAKIKAENIKNQQADDKNQTVAPKRNIKELIIYKLIQLGIVLLGMAVAYLLKTDYDAFGVIYIVLFYVFRNDEVKRNIMTGVTILWEITAPLALIPIHFYNGKRGLNLKYFFYLFYPVHLLILGLITNYFFG